MGGVELSTMFDMTTSTGAQATSTLCHVSACWIALRQQSHHFVRPHESLRVRLAQPMDRGGKRQPQHYRQRTPAMAAGLTNRRWTVREVLMFPLAPELCGVG